MRIFFFDKFLDLELNNARRDLLALFVQHHPVSEALSRIGRQVLVDRSVPRDPSGRETEMPPSAFGASQGEEPITVGVTSSTGIETTEEIAAACGDMLELCRAAPVVDWAYLSPPATLLPGDKTVRFTIVGLPPVSGS